MYMPNQESMTPIHPVEIMRAGLKYVMSLMADKEDINKRVIEKQQTYLPSHFNGYDKQKLFPAKSFNPHAVHRYDYKILETLYNVYTRDLPNGKQLVTSIWDRTKNEQIDDLEILVKKHNHIH